MKFRKSSLRSVHASSNKQLKNIELNDDDIRLINGEDMRSNSGVDKYNGMEKENSILNRLLLLQPVHNNAKNELNNNSNNKKLTLNNNSNYLKHTQTFKKPDVESLIQENIQLKTLIQANNHSINCLKVKNKQFEKKCKFLEKAMHKYQQKITDNNQNARNQNITDDQHNNNNNHHQGILETVTKNFVRGDSVHSNNNKVQSNITNSLCTGMVHTEILKKKISDLTAIYLKGENELKALRRLPNATIYEQNDIEKEYLIAEAVRLKAIVASLSNEVQMNNQSHSVVQFDSLVQSNIAGGQSSEQKFQSHFMRLMKEQNQKLKSTIRLLQNDKILLKSRQTIMNKYNNDLKKQLQLLKQRICYKQAQVEKLNNQNKNLLFKKTTQYKQEEEKKQSEVISELRMKYNDLEGQYKKILQLNDFYSEENVNLKEKQKNLLNQLSEMESKYQKNIKLLNEQNETIQFQLNTLKIDYYNLIKEGNAKKKKSIVNSSIFTGMGNMIQPINTPEVTYDQNHRMDRERKDQSAFRNSNNNFNNAINMTNCTNVDNNSAAIKSAFVLLSKSQGGSSNNKKKIQAKGTINRQIYNKPVKFKDIYLGLLNLYSFCQIEEQKHSNPQKDEYFYINIVIEKILYDLISQDDDVANKSEYIKNLSYCELNLRKQKKCYELINLFCEQPYNMDKKESTKLARYIVEDDSNIIEMKDSLINTYETNNKNISNCTLVFNTNPNKRNNEKVVFNDNNAVDLNLIKDILKSALFKIKEKDNIEKFQHKWVDIINKNNSRKMLQALTDYENGIITNEKQGTVQDRDRQYQIVEFIKLAQLIELLNGKVSRKKIQSEDYEYITIKCFDKDKSDEDICLNIKKIIKFFQEITSF